MIHDDRDPPIRVGAGPTDAYGCSAVLGAGLMMRSGALDFCALVISGVISELAAKFSRGPAVTPSLTPEGARVAHVAHFWRCRRGQTDSGRP